MSMHAAAVDAWQGEPEIAMTAGLALVDISKSYGGVQALSNVSLSVHPGEVLGLVGDNGAGKTTLLKIIAGAHAPSSGTMYLGDEEVTFQTPHAAKEAGIATVYQDLALAGQRDVVANFFLGREILSKHPLGRMLGWLDRKAMRAHTIEELARLGTRIPDVSLAANALSGGQRQALAIARAAAWTSKVLLLDEPTNHLDADSVTWLRNYLRGYSGGLVVISHDTDLLEATVNRVLHLDATRQVIDVYNMGWRAYREQVASDERRRQRERANAERKIVTLRSQADRMRATATKARAAHQLDRRAARIAGGLPETRSQDKVAKLRFPDPAPCGRTPLTATGLSKGYGSLEVFSGVDLAIDRGSRVVVLGLNGAGKTTLLRVLAGVEIPDAGEVVPGHGLRLGYYAQEHETLDAHAGVFDNVRRNAPSSLTDVELRRILGAFLFGGDRVDQPAGTLSGGEKTRLALAALVVSSANVLLLDEPTNNLDPASRAEVLGALRSYAGAIVLVTHDQGAVEALQPERVLLMPDGVEDHWSDELGDLVALA